MVVVWRGGAGGIIQVFALARIPVIPPRDNKENGCDIDKPKNLAKSVTIE